MKSWNVSVNGSLHEIGYKPNTFKPRVIIDGVEQKIKSKSYFTNLIDHPIQIQDKILNLVRIGNYVDLAVDGIFLNSKKRYVPMDKSPIWVIVLATISFIVGILIGAALGAGIMLCFSAFMIKASINPAKSKNSRNIKCIIVFILSLITMALYFALLRNVLL